MGALKKYIYIGWYYPAGSGKLPDASRSTVWNFYEADKPWEPWIQFGESKFEPEGYYSPQIVPKLISSDGKKFTVVTSGDWNNDLFYRLTFVPVEIRGNRFVDLVVMIASYNLHAKKQLDGLRLILVRELEKWLTNDLVDIPSFLHWLR